MSKLHLRNKQQIPTYTEIPKWPKLTHYRRYNQIDILHNLHPNKIIWYYDVMYIKYTGKYTIELCLW